MRLVSHSVVICTAGDELQPRAVTLSSFTSLALGPPPPVISFNIATPSRTLDALRASRFFNIHIISGDERGAALANSFSRAGAGNIFSSSSSSSSPPSFSNVLASLLSSSGRGTCCSSTPSQDQFASPQKTTTKTTTTTPLSSWTTPLLQGPGILRVLCCRLLEGEPSDGLVTVRDHVIVLGEVVDILDGGGGDDKRSVVAGEATSMDKDGTVQDHQDFGLIYADRRYRRLGAALLGSCGDE